MENPEQTQFIEQKISQRATVSAGATGIVSVTIPANTKAFLKGYGYSWFTTTTYTLRAGNTQFPSRTDQEGSAAMPVIYAKPFMANSGETFSLTILNGDSADHTYDVVFYVLSSRILQVSSTGGEILVPTGSGGGGVPSIVTIADSSGATKAGVTAKGLAVEPQAPATLIDGTKSITSATAAAIAATTALKKGLMIEADSANTDYVAIGNATTQSFKLYAGDSIFIEIDDIAKIFVKKNAANVTINYMGS